MCRNIKTLFNFDPPVTPDEVHAASLQFVRKITGFNKPSKANEAAFQAAIDEIAAISNRLLRSLDVGKAWIKMLTLQLGVLIDPYLKDSA